MKKFLAMFLVVTLCFSTVGCGKKDSAPEPSEETQESEQVSAGDNVGVNHFDTDQIPETHQQPVATEEPEEDYDPRTRWTNPYEELFYGGNYVLYCTTEINGVSCNYTLEHSNDGYSVETYSTPNATFVVGTVDDVSYVVCDDRILTSDILEASFYSMVTFPEIKNIVQFTYINGEEVSGYDAFLMDSDSQYLGTLYVDHELEKAAYLVYSTYTMYISELTERTFDASGAEKVSYQELQTTASNVIGKMLYGDSLNTNTDEGIDDLMPDEGEGQVPDGDETFGTN